MNSAAAPQKSGKKGWWFGLIVGIVLVTVTVLASGFMIETTNTDTFCVSCHIMTPFRASWQDAVHGGQNPQGFAAQCVDCHLPHGDFFQFLTVKAITGTSDLIHNLYIDPVTYELHRMPWQEDAGHYGRLAAKSYESCRYFLLRLSCGGKIFTHGQSVRRR